MRFGDYIVCINIITNASAAMAYAYQGHWVNAAYWACAFGLNVCLINLR